MKTNLGMRIALFFSALLTFLTVGCGGGLGPTETTGSVGTTQNSLVAKYVLPTSQVGASAWVEFGTDTTYGRQTSPTTATTSGQNLSILVAGMRPNTTYHMRAHVDYLSGTWIDQDQTFTTGPLPSQGGTSSPPGTPVPPGLTV